MKKRSVIIVAVAVLFGAAAFFTSNPGSADPITVNGPFHFRDNRSANSVGLAVGDKLTFGAHDVVPNGGNGTTGVATQGSVSRTLLFEPYSVRPNQFNNSINYNSNLIGSWTLTFFNGPDTTSVSTPEVGIAPQVPFAQSVSISGSGLQPTFNWTVPNGFTPDGIRLQIWDLETGPIGTGTSVDVIHVVNRPGNTTSYQVPLNLSSGKSLEQGHLYSFEISLAQTREVPLGDNTTLLSRSRSFFDFKTLPPNAPPNVFLPIVTPGPIPVYSFHTTVVGGQTIFIDPPVAIGYDYAIGTGNPNFASVTLPTGIGDNMFDLYLFNGTDFFFKTHLAGGNTFTFDPGGVDRFRILGIEPSAGLDPQNPTAFITGLTFVGSGEFTGTMTPILDFSLTPYDNFSGTYIDKNKWRQGEFVREIQGGKLISKTTAYGSRVTNNLNFSNPASINNIQADVTINKIEGDFGFTATNNYSSPNARITGFFYNDGSASGPGSYKGEVQGAIRISPYNGMYWVYWLIWKLTNDGGTNWTTLAWNWFPNPVSLNTTYKLFVQFEPDSKTFTFKVGDSVRTWTSTDTIYPSNIPWKAIGTDVYFTGTGTQLHGKISATFDNVYVNSEPYDDFSIPAIDSTKWTTYEVVREISEGKLRSKLRSSSAYTTFANNTLEFAYPDSINTIQSKVTLVDYQNPQGLYEWVDIDGAFYNDGTPGGGHIGDVVAQVLIGGNGLSPIAGWRVYKYTDAAGNVSTQVASGAFTTPITLGNTYTLYLVWNGSEFTFKIGDEEAHYSPVTAINPVNISFKRVRTLISPQADKKEGTIEALFDDVMVEMYFSDVSLEHWAENYIIAIYNAGITTGCVQDDPNTPQNERQYCPENSVTREQMAAFIVRGLEGEPPANYCDSGTPFPDVTSDMWSCKYIKRLKELGITTGYQDGTYGPYDFVPREQMAAFIVRALEGEPPANYCDTGSPFSDVDANYWACKYIKKLYELGITTGCAQNPLRYCPNDTVTRAQMAAFLARAFLGMQ